MCNFSTGKGENPDRDCPNKTLSCCIVKSKNKTKANAETKQSQPSFGQKSTFCVHAHLGKAGGALRRCQVRVSCWARDGAAANSPCLAELPSVPGPWRGVPHGPRAARGVLAQLGARAVLVGVGASCPLPGQSRGALLLPGPHKG